MPGRKSTILYWPSPSVMAARTFSMSAGLDASTVTPGSTAPVLSLTEPAMIPVCAWAMPDAAIRTATVQLATDLQDIPPPHGKPPGHAALDVAPRRSGPVVRINQRPGPSGRPERYDR